MAPLVQPLLLPLPAEAGVPLRWHERIIHEDDVSFVQCFLIYISTYFKSSQDCYYYTAVPSVDFRGLFKSLLCIFSGNCGSEHDD